MRKPAETRSLVVLGLLVAGSLFCGCGSGGVRPTPALLPSQIPAAPVSVSQLTAAPTVTDLAGRFAYGTDVGHIWVVDAVTGQRTQVTHGRGGIDFDPHWSPDGERLVFRSERFHAPDPTSTSYDGIFVINADGTGEHSREDIGKPAVEPWCTSDTTGYIESRASYYCPLSERNFRSVAGVGFEPT